MQMWLSEVAEQISAEHIGEDAVFSRVSIDTRTINEGDLFVALTGENFDGHDYLEKACDSGAVAAMVSRQLKMMLPMLNVKDTRLGLGQLAALWRSRFNIPLVAVTGSNGKTTVKDMIASIMTCKGDVLSTLGNLNNDIGVPLTLLRLKKHHHTAVIEMGANHSGEILYLSGLARPDVAVITNAAAAHLAGFGSMEGVARAKGEIYSNLNMNGVAVVNADDAFAPLWKTMAGSRKMILFGLGDDADVTAEWQQYDDHLQLQMQTPVGECVVRLELLGRHNILNALAASASAISMGADADAVVRGLENMKPVSGRLQSRPGLKDMRILDDTYNANPASLEAALDVLSEMSGEKWLILGDMGELGEDTAELHANCGRLVRERGVDRLYTLGELARHAAVSFGDYGVGFQDTHELVERIRKDWHGQGTLLVKGSRLMHMEQVVTELSGEAAG